MSGGDGSGGRYQQRPRVQSVARAMQMVELVARSDEGLTAKEISDVSGVNRSATYHLLHTLTQTEVLARNGRRYVMGMRAGVFAAGLTRHRSEKARVAASARALAGTIRETVVVSAWGSPGITVLGRAGGVAVATELTRGYSSDGHARASGKLLLALGSEDAKVRFLETSPLKPRTRNTIVDRSSFTRALDETRERGYAIDNEEFLPGICCMAAPLKTGQGFAALSIVAPAERFRAERSLFAAELVRAASRGSLAAAA